MAKAKVITYTGSTEEAYGEESKASLCSISIEFPKRPRIPFLQGKAFAKKVEKLVAAWQPKK